MINEHLKAGRQYKIKEKKISKMDTVGNRTCHRVIRLEQECDLKTQLLGHTDLYSRRDFILMCICNTVKTVFAIFQEDKTF